MHNIFKILVLGLLCASFLAPSNVFAQSLSGQNTAKGQSYGASSQSDFQNAGFQQSGSSAATTAAGSAEALRQSTNQTITVSGAPANQTELTEQNNGNTKLLLWLLFTLSLGGLIASYIVQRKAQASARPDNAEKAAPKSQPAVSSKNPKPKKPKKKPTKKKKTHR